jgi:hypothetical protein
MFHIPIMLFTSGKPPRFTRWLCGDVIWRYSRVDPGFFCWLSASSKTLSAITSPVLVSVVTAAAVGTELVNIKPGNGLEWEVLFVTSRATIRYLTFGNSWICWAFVRTP